MTAMVELIIGVKELPNLSQPILKGTLISLHHCWDITLKNKEVNPTVALERKSRDCQSQQDSSSKNPEYAYKISRQSLQYLSRYFNLDQLTTADVA